MQVKRYEAANIQDALRKIKGDLGPEAIVLSTKRMPGKNNLLEVMAARDSYQDSDPATAGIGERGESGSFSAGGEALAYLRTEMEELKSLMRGVKRDGLHEELAELKDNMHALFDVLGFRHKSERSALSRMYAYLVGRGVSKARACKLLEEMRRKCPGQEILDYEQALQAAEGILSRSCKAPDSDERGKRVKIFVGPTGVGKTTTLAKLAARYALEKKLAVGLITTDTYRIAALEQLKVYARIMGLPLEVASEKGHFRQALDRLGDRDVILVDTPGRGRADDDSLPRLQDMLSGNGERETNLLLSLTSSREHLMDVVARYGQMGCDQLIFTKLDECQTCGMLYDVMEQAEIPVSYVTTGQNVPKDIRRMNPARLAELIMRHN